MADSRSSSRPEHADASRASLSTAQQVVYWLMLTSLVVAVVLMGVWWILAALPATGSMAFIFVFATLGLWATIYRLMILGIKRLVRTRVARGATARE